MSGGQQVAGARSFAADTLVEQVATGRYQAPLSPQWDIAGNANGGFMLAIAARAMAQEAGRPDPVTITAHYLAPGRPGPTEVEVQVAKRGKRFVVVSATMSAAGKPLLQLLGTFGDLSTPDHGPRIIDAAPPELPPPEDCLRYGGQPGLPAMYDNVDLRLHPEDAWFAGGERSGRMRVRGWLRFPGDALTDVMSLLLAVDAFPPTVFNAPTGLTIAWVPTIELTVHLRARPAPGWLRAIFTSRFLSSGFVEEDGEIWDQTGTLVAQSRQLALLPLT